MSSTTKNMDDRFEQSAELRRQAEEKVRATEPQSLESRSPEETRKILHALRVHQIELEMQNEELRRAQVELDAARARYFNFYDLAPVGYCTLSEKGLIFEANLTAATLLGVARDALVKRPITRFILKEDQDIYYRHNEQLFETDDPYDCELRMVKKDKTDFWVHLAATAAQDNGAPMCRLVISEITERKRTQEALRESEERYRSLFLNMINGFAYCKMLYANGEPEDFVYLEVNAAFETLTGLKDLVGKRATEVIPDIKELHPEFFAIYGRVAMTGQPEYFEILFQPLNLWLAISVYSPKREHFVAIFDNITERKQAEREIRESHEEARMLTRRLAQAEELERTHLARELHDQVGQSLSSIGINLGFVQAKLSPEMLPEVHERIEASMDLVERTARNIRNIMTQLRPLVLDDFGLLAALVWLAEQSHQITGIAVEVLGELPEPRPTREVETALFRITQEALANIVKHAGASQVTIEIGRSADGLRVSIADDGVGFDVQAASFKREPDRHMGLLNMRERAASIGGVLNIESKPGKGTRIIIEVKEAFECDSR